MQTIVDIVTTVLPNCGQIGTHDMWGCCHSGKSGSQQSVWQDSSDCLLIVSVYHLLLEFLNNNMRIPSQDLINNFNDSHLHTLLCLSDDQSSFSPPLQV